MKRGADPVHLGEELARARAVLRHVPPGRATAVLARLLVGAMALAAAALALVPWQQTARGEGRVIAYTPGERPQPVDAPIEGRVVAWHVREGDRVKAGAPLCNLSDNDPQILERLQAEREAVLMRIEAARSRTRSIGGRIGALESSQRSASVGAGARVQMARARVRSAEQAVLAAAVAHRTARLNLARQKELLTSGLTARRQLELAELEEARAATELDRAEAALSAARSEESALAADQGRLVGDTQATIRDASATRAAAEGDLANALAELARIDVRLARQTTQAVTAPRDGVIQRVIARGGELVKAGDPLAVLVPDTRERAVELWIPGNDVPLVSRGQEVRLQFEGWPAVQFSGWPELDYGTFQARVGFVDPTDDGHGRFRVVVEPAGQRWPDPERLRQGARATGWIQLGRVTLGYELWRQWNGFPPVLPPPAGDKAEGTGKEGK